MNTNLIQRNLWRKLQGKKYRHSFVSSQIGANIAAQIACTRVARGWTQKELAAHAKMSQVRISVLEDPNYENFSIKTLRRLAQAFDTALIVKFAPFSEMLGWITTLQPENMAVQKFEEDAMKIEEVRPLPISVVAEPGSSQEENYPTAAASASVAKNYPLPSLNNQGNWTHVQPKPMQQLVGGLQCGL